MKYSLRSETRHAVRKSGAAREFVFALRQRGRVAFGLEELTHATGLSILAAARQLARMGRFVRRVTPRQEFFLIVDPENQPLGAPPPAWWLDAYFAWLGRPYYLALQSAAAEYGSTAQALQVTQVMTDAPRRDIELVRIRIQFFVKSAVSETPTQMAAHSFAPLLVSTPEATALDLVRYSPRIGGIERVAETLRPMLRRLRPSMLASALADGIETPTIQRLGFLLAAEGCDRLADVVRARLPRALKPVLLDIGAAGTASGRDAPLDAAWAVLVNADLGQRG